MKYIALASLVFVMLSGCNSSSGSGSSRKSPSTVSLKIVSGPPDKVEGTASSREKNYLYEFNSPWGEVLATLKDELQEPTWQLTEYKHGAVFRIRSSPPGYSTVQVSVGEGGLTEENDINKAHIIVKEIRD